MNWIMNLNPIPLSEVQIGDFIATAEGQIWYIDSMESLLNLPHVAYWYEEAGLNLPVAFKTQREAECWFHRN